MAKARLPKRGSRLASQAVVDPSGLLPQAQAQAVPSPRVGCGDPPPFSPLREPQLLIRVVATPKADFLRAILCQHTLEHFHREEGAERELVKALVMRQLANYGAAVPYEPELCCRWNTIDIVNPEPQRSQVPGEPDQCRNELRKVLGWLPTRGVDRLVICQCLIEP